MRPRADWMTKADDHILELLSEAGIAANPATIAFNIDYDGGYVAHRCRELAGHDLISRVHETKAMYRITDLGERYLCGEVNIEELK